MRIGRLLHVSLSGGLSCHELLLLLLLHLWRLGGCTCAIMAMRAGLHAHVLFSLDLELCRHYSIVDDRHGAIVAEVDGHEQMRNIGPVAVVAKHVQVEQGRKELETREQ